MWQNNSQMSMRNHLLRHWTQQECEGEGLEGEEDLQWSILKPESIDAYKEEFLLNSAKIICCSLHNLVDFFMAANCQEIFSSASLSCSHFILTLATNWITDSTFFMLKNIFYVQQSSFFTYLSWTACGRKYWYTLTFFFQFNSFLSLFGKADPLSLSTK